jgi:hypothetical protein
MNTQTQTQNSSTYPVYQMLQEESKFWLHAIASWRTVITNLVEKSNDVKASPEITAEVAKTAGDLSLLAERLDPLFRDVDEHHRLFLMCMEHECDVTECTQRHSTLFSRVRSESEEFRTLVRQLFRLEKAAYRKFIS